KRDVLYVGDTLTDYLTAQNAGIDVALVTWTPRDLPPEAKPTYYIDSFNEFFEVINHGKTN
ncbi:MAG TPA: HAD hydrolase-like protein, partial [Bacilli bacterium]|nr:HAD hydrolase-like protein [Bacilli bacterium]